MSGIIKTCTVLEALPSGKAVVSVDLCPFIPIGVVGLEAVAPGQGIRYDVIVGHYGDGDDVLALFRLIKDFSVFPKNGDAILSACIKHTVFIDIQSRNIGAGMGIQHLAVLPNVCSVVGG